MSTVNQYPKYSELKTLTEPEWLFWIIRGCGHAYGLLIYKHERWIKDRLYFLMHNKTGEKEVYQRFLIRMWKALLRGLYKQTEDGDFRHWMGTILKNMVNEYRRRPKKFVEMTEETEPLLPAMQDTNIQKYEWANDLEKLEYGLREDYRDLFNMKAVGELSIKEIAEIVHKSEGTVKSGIQRGREYLKKQLAGYYLNRRIKKHTPVKLGAEQKKSALSLRSVNDDNNLHTWKLHGGKWIVN